MEINSEEVVTKIATNVFEDIIRAGWNKVTKYFKDESRKDSIDYKDAYTYYLKNTYLKYSKIKTLIYRKVPKKLYSFYECIGVSYGKKVIDTSKVSNLLSISSKIIVTGTGGIGKSILFKHFFINAMKETDLVPVLIELRSFNMLETICLKDVIYNVLVENGFTLEREYFEYSLTKGAYLLLLDGLDEVNRDKAMKVSEEIRKLSNQYNKNKFIVSSRPSDEFISWNDFDEMPSRHLSKQQAVSLINRLEFDECIKRKFVQDLEVTLYEKYKSFASNPLLLNIMLLTFNNHASIPDKLNDFYEQAFVTLFNMHDATKDSYVRDIRTGLGCEDFKIIFAYICFKSYFKDQYEFTESELRGYIQEAKEKFDKFSFSVDDFQEDLILSVCMIIKEGLSYRFSHRSFQEYFSAWYTCKLTDEVQTKLLTSWIKESRSIRSDAYFSMLYDMQSEKVNKIIFAPGLRQLRRLYKEKGFSIDFIEILFSKIGVRESHDKVNNKKYSLTLTIKNEYLCFMFILSSNLNGYTQAEQNNEITDEVSRQLIKNKKTNFHPKVSRKKEFNIVHCEYDIKSAAECVGEDKLLEALGFLNKTILFSLDILEKNSKTSISRKKKVSSIIDEL